MAINQKTSYEENFLNSSVCSKYSFTENSSNIGTFIVVLREMCFTRDHRRTIFHISLNH